MSNFDFDFEKYVSLMKAGASLTRLFSEEQHAYFDPSFVEKLFIYASAGKDLSKKYNSFDVLLERDSAASIGVGIKTFGVPNERSAKKEKVAEMTNFASNGEFDGLKQEKLAVAVSEKRNARILSDIAEYNIDLSKSYYHCLLRTNKGVFIHQEPYELIDVKNIHPVKGSGRNIKKLDKFPDNSGSPLFSDGKNIYTYGKAKNVLNKLFDTRKGVNSELMPVQIIENILEELLAWHQMKQGVIVSPKKKIVTPLASGAKAFEILSPTSAKKGVPGKDYVVLPLYSKVADKKVVHEQSGLNAWNAGGRNRKFGEAYIQNPAKVRSINPTFFPTKDVKFLLKLPNGLLAKAKICQQDSKALMTDPNDILCSWLFPVIEQGFNDRTAQMRLKRQMPYTYNDLAKVGKDCVKVSKDVKNGKTIYSIEFADVDSYEDFLEEASESS